MEARFSRIVAGAEQSQDGLKHFKLKWWTWKVRNCWLNLIWILEYFQTRWELLIWLKMFARFQRFFCIDLLHNPTMFQTNRKLNLETISQATKNIFNCHSQLLFASRFLSLSQRPLLSAKWFYLSEILIRVDDVIWQRHMQPGGEKTNFSHCGSSDLWNALGRHRCEWSAMILSSLEQVSWFMKGNRPAAGNRMLIEASLEIISLGFNSCWLPPENRFLPEAVRMVLAESRTRAWINVYRLLLMGFPWGRPSAFHRPSNMFVYLRGACFSPSSSDPRKPRNGKFLDNNLGK